MTNQKGFTAVEGLLIALAYLALAMLTRAALRALGRVIFKAR